MNIGPTPARRSPIATDHAFPTVLLISAGVLALGDRLWPAAGLLTTIGFVLGAELLVRGWLARHRGSWTAGGLTTGTGLGVLLVGGPLAGAGHPVQVGAMLLAIGAGFALLATLTRVVTGDAAGWAWIPAAILAGFGAALLVGGPGSTGSEVLGWAVAVVLIALGVVALLRGRVNDRAV